MRQDSGIGVLDKAVVVLHAVADAPCGLAELCQRTGLPRATAHRLAAGLEFHRLLARDDTGRWNLGPGLTELAARVDDPLLAAGEVVLPGLREITGESVQMYRREGSDRVCVAALEPPAGLRDTVPVGARLPMTAGFGRPGAAGLQRPGDPAGRAARRHLHRTDAGRGAPPGLGAERGRARTRSGQRVSPGARPHRRGDRRGVGVRADRPDRPAPRGTVGRRPIGCQPGAHRAVVNADLPSTLRPDRDSGRIHDLGADSRGGR